MKGSPLIIKEDGQEDISENRKYFQKIILIDLEKGNRADISKKARKPLGRRFRKTLRGMLDKDLFMSLLT